MTKKKCLPDRKKKRTYLKQSEVPGATLEDSIRIPRAIHENFAGEPTTPLLVAQALNVDPGGSQLKVLSGAAIAYGLIEGGSQASTISLTELSNRILRPTEEGMDLAAKREAILRPRVFGEFLRKYDNKSLPREDLGLNVLETMGVPRDKTNEVFTRIIDSAQNVNLVTEIKGKKYINLDNVPAMKPLEGAVGETDEENEDESIEENGASGGLSHPAVTEVPESSLNRIDDPRRRRVFITHGKNKTFVAPLKSILEFGELTPVVAVEQQSVSKPVPEKVMDDMRSCGAAVIHVDAENRMIDSDGNEHTVLNPNVLIEIGAAMAFYGRRFILLVREGVKLPSNLQGLYEVRYSDDSLGGDVTIKVLQAIKDIKNYSLPTDTPQP